MFSDLDNQQKDREMRDNVFQVCGSGFFFIINNIINELANIKKTRFISSLIFFNIDWRNDGLKVGSVARMLVDICF